MNLEEYQDLWRDRPPTAEELAELGFDPDLSFGIEFEYYSHSSREELAPLLTEETGQNIVAERWNNQNRNYWKLISDSSLHNSYEYDDDDGEYDCDDCEVDPSCGQDCEENGATQIGYACYSCRQAPRSMRRSNRPFGNESQAEADANWQASQAYLNCQLSHSGGRDIAFCEAYGTAFIYDCDTCSTTPECDGDCSFHCNPNRREEARDFIYGHELVTPPLHGEEGVVNLWRVLHELNDSASPDCDTTCGLHVHIGVRPYRSGEEEFLEDDDVRQESAEMTAAQMRHLLALYTKYEVAIDALLPRPRREHNCSCARSLIAGDNYNSIIYSPQLLQPRLTEIYEARDLAALTRLMRRDRYLKLNLTSFTLHGTIEYRQHHGTTDFAQTFLWVLFVQHLHRRALSLRRHLSMDTELPTPPALFAELRLPAALNDYWDSRALCYSNSHEERLRELRGCAFDEIYSQAARDNRHFDNLREQERLRHEEHSRAREGRIWADHVRELARTLGIDLRDDHVVHLRQRNQRNRAFELPDSVRAIFYREYDGLPVRNPNWDPWLHQPEDGLAHVREYPGIAANPLYHNPLVTIDNPYF